MVLLAWDFLDYGSTDAELQIRQLQRIAPLLPDPQQVRITFFGDAEFSAVELQQFCRAQGWHWHVGVKSDTLFHQGDEIWRPLRAIPVQRGERHYVAGLTLTEQHAFGPVNLIIDWNPNENPLATGCSTRWSTSTPGGVGANVSGLSRPTVI